MKKLFLIGLLSMLVSVKVAEAAAPDEGMWLPMFVERLNYVDMQKMGLKLTAEELYSINNSSIKDAIVSLGGFCTAELVSPEGLLLTNHHCGYSAIQTHSSVEHDYLTDGFWAMKKSEELPNEGLTVTFLHHMEDMTQKILSVVNDDMTEDERSEAIRKEIDKYTKEAEQDGKYVVELKSFFNGNEYYMFVYEEYKDVRLVGAPPSSIGKFGGDTDNWMWPRHTGDFAMFRIYTAPDGSPAEYSEDNIPFKSKYFLPISIKGYKENDFAMIWGFPGTTDRYRTSSAVSATLNEINPAIVKMLRAMLDVQDEEMAKSDKVRIQYASNNASLANFWKNKLGETRDLKRLNVVEKKRQSEKELEKWINADPARKAKYGTVLSDFNEVYSKYTEQNIFPLLWNTQLVFFGSQAFTLPSMSKGIETILKTGVKGEALQKEMQSYREKAEAIFKDYDNTIERRVLATALEIFRDEIPTNQHPDIYKVINSKFKGDIAKFVDYIFEKSPFLTYDNFNKFLDKPSEKAIKKDLAVEMYNSFVMNFMSVQGGAKELATKNNATRRLYLAALREMYPDKSFYPDANSTLRMTYGKVISYYPADAVHYDYYTTIEGVMAKENPSDPDFVVPERLKQLYYKKDFGQYAENGTLPVCFLTDNDITGGNSGSPVLDGDGNLIGIAFDGNWEAMSGNILFEPELQRTINVDARYVLWVIDKYAGAKNIMDELTIVK